MRCVFEQIVYALNSLFKGYGARTANGISHYLTTICIKLEAFFFSSESIKHAANSVLKFESEHVL